MQNPASLLTTTTTNPLRQSVKRFFNLPSEQPHLLNRQPLAQRQLFLKKAVSHHYIVFIQLRPRQQSGQPTNLQGIIHQLDHQHYLLTRGHVNYLFTIDQLQYLARL